MYILQKKPHFFLWCLYSCQVFGCFLKTTHSLSTYHLPPTNLPPNTSQRPLNTRSLTKCTDQLSTEHWPRKNTRTRNSITNFKWISDKNMWDRVINIISRNYFLIKAGMCYWKDKSLKVKLIKCKTYRNCNWIKTIKTGEKLAD